MYNCMWFLELLADFVRVKVLSILSFCEHVLTSSGSSG